MKKVLSRVLSRALKKALSKVLSRVLSKKGIEQGIEKGEQKKAIATARLMLSKGYPLSDITEMTGLTEAQLREAGLI